ncbi:hypothetical protein SmJEL517_g01232 [Synchytrium microbalum]|uniref:Integrator complex subunit 11 n=1 Tax=Synchytrium microbalum TaxID=1806994 RepID=A0A507CGD5_9FUNG|nr:uncharacterized protein SmJEL517_g01232 [Synchytrium microbalum]TPX36553.1 hypothetical protein SmJEL517_g01232 [Synchytrium microbalum]
MAYTSRIQVIPLGAGQDVGRSCILARIGPVNIMLDCGQHMGYTDHRRFPDFHYLKSDLSAPGTLNKLIDVVLISHAHLDHCGALPYLTEVIGYDGPLIMTPPTRDMLPIMLEDARKVAVDRRGEVNYFSAENIRSCLSKVTTIEQDETIRLPGPTADSDIEITCYYAGHILGAAMFRIKYGMQSLVYTGDFNTTPDRHLGEARIDKCRPDVLITESTYATLIRDSRLVRERMFLQDVYTQTIEKKGKVLIPVFALGRSQELCILLEGFWKRKNIQVPIYFSGGLTEKSLEFYKMYISWTNESLRNQLGQENVNAFDFKFIKPWKPEYINNPGPAVLFATPGMLSAGTSLEVLRAWAGDANNMIIIPGFQSAGSVGAKLLANQPEIYTPDNPEPIRPKLAIRNLSFSAHADAKGILSLIEKCAPSNVVLVHGEANKMVKLKAQIEDAPLRIPCFMPANGEPVDFYTRHRAPAYVSREQLDKAREAFRPKNVVGVNGKVNVALLKPLTHQELEELVLGELCEDCQLVVIDEENK